MVLDRQGDAMVHAMNRLIDKSRTHFAHCAAGLDALSPLKVLGRGYSIVMDREGTVISSADAVCVGQKLDVTLGKGSLTCTVDERKCP